MAETTYVFSRIHRHSLTISSAQLGTDEPIMNFRPHLWKHLDTDTKSLMLDLFWPVKTGEEDDGVFVNVPKDNDDHIIVEEQGLPLDDLKPILAFRNLQVLQLSGMMLSYDPPLPSYPYVDPANVISQIPTCPLASRLVQPQPGNLAARDGYCANVQRGLPTPQPHHRPQVELLPDHGGHLINPHRQQPSVHRACGV